MLTSDAGTHYYDMIIGENLRFPRHYDDPFLTRGFPHLLSSPHGDDVVKLKN